MTTISADPATLRRDALALDSINNRLLALVLRERAAYRLMYLSAFALAVELQDTIDKQQAIIREQDECWARVSRRLFLPCGDEG